MDFRYWDPLALQQSGKVASDYFSNDGGKIDRSEKRGYDTMNEKKFIDMIISERISLLPERKEEGQKDAASDRWDELMEEVGEELKGQLEACLDEMIRVQSEKQEAVYLGGFRDGAHVALEISKLGSWSI